MKLRLDVPSPLLVFRPDKLSPPLATAPVRLAVLPAAEIVSRVAPTPYRLRVLTNDKVAKLGLQLPLPVALSGATRMSSSLSPNRVSPFPTVACGRPLTVPSLPDQTGLSPFRLPPALEVINAVPKRHPTA